MTFNAARNLKLISLFEVSKIKGVNGNKKNAIMCMNILFTSVCIPEQINVREYRRGNQKRKINRNRQHRVRCTRRRQTRQKHNTRCIGHHYAQANTNNVTERQKKKK